MEVWKYHNYDTKKYYTVAAMSQELATEHLHEEVGTPWDAVEEIQEREWDKPMISVWEDNNFNNKPFKMTIREAIIGTDPQIIFTNDFSTF